MYNKLFSKIVTSSIWLEPTPTRIVWLMFIALMNEDGFVQFASVANVAHTARITDDEAEKAIEILSAPDANSADPGNEGRRIEKVPGGWMVLNASKYRDLVTREMVRAQTRERVARHRAKSNDVTLRNANVTARNGKVTQSDTDTDTDTRKEKRKEALNKSTPPSSSEDWIKSLESKPIYAGMNIRAIHSKMTVWCEIRGLKPTLRRLVNWLNKEDKPLPTQKPQTYGKQYLPPPREVSDSELQKAREVAQRETEALRKKLLTQ